MGTTTRLTFAEYERLPEKEGTRYEPDEGTLLMEPSPALRHNLVYPALRLIEVHDSAGPRRITEPESLQESKLFGGDNFSLSLPALFDDVFRQ